MPEEVSQKVTNTEGDLGTESLSGTPAAPPVLDFANLPDSNVRLEVPVPGGTNVVNANPPLPNTGDTIEAPVVDRKIPINQSTQKVNDAGEAARVRDIATVVAHHQDEEKIIESERRLGLIEEGEAETSLSISRQADQRAGEKEKERAADAPRFLEPAQQQFFKENLAAEPAHDKPSKQIQSNVRGPAAEIHEDRHSKDPAKDIAKQKQSEIKSPESEVKRASPEPRQERNEGQKTTPSHQDVGSETRHEVKAPKPEIKQEPKQDVKLDAKQDLKQEIKQPPARERENSPQREPVIHRETRHVENPKTATTWKESAAPQREERRVEIRQEVRREEVRTSEAKTESRPIVASSQPSSRHVETEQRRSEPQRTAPEVQVSERKVIVEPRVDTRRVENERGVETTRVERVVVQEQIREERPTVHASLREQIEKLERSDKQGESVVLREMPEVQVRQIGEGEIIHLRHAISEIETNKEGAALESREIRVLPRVEVTEQAHPVTISMETLHERRIEAVVGILNEGERVLQALVEKDAPAAIQKLAQVEGALQEVVRMKVEQFISLSVRTSGASQAEIQMLIREAIGELANLYQLTPEQRALLNMIQIAITTGEIQTDSDRKPQESKEAKEKTVEGADKEKQLLSEKVEVERIGGKAQKVGAALESKVLDDRDLEDRIRQNLLMEKLLKKSPEEELNPDAEALEAKQQVQEKKKLETSEVHIIHGKVVSGKTGMGIAGIIIDGGSLGTRVTDAVGEFEFKNIPLNTSYTIVARRKRYGFEPSVATGTVTMSAYHVFTAIREP